MSLAYQLDAWNSLSGLNSTTTYDAPSQWEMDNSRFVDSSGNFAQGLSMGNMLKAGGSVFSAYGDLMAGDQANDAYQYNAQLSLEQSKFAIDKLDKSEVGFLSTQRAMYSKAGVEMTGSPIDAALNTAMNFEMDKQITRYNAESRANMARYEGQMAKSQGQIKAGMDLLSGGASLGAAIFL